MMRREQPKGTAVSRTKVLRGQKFLEEVGRTEETANSSKIR